MIARILNGLAALLGAGAFAQFPVFYQQYLQRLGGRLDQTRADLQRLLNDAQAIGRSIEVYLEELQNSGTIAAGQAAKRELERLDRADSFETAYGALQQATPLERPFVFAQHLDPEVAQDTLTSFEPALPFTPEGLTYALVGALVAIILLACGERCAGALRPRRKTVDLDQSHGRR